MSLCYGLESLVVVFPAPADLFNVVLTAVEVHHFVEHGVKRLLYGVVEHLCGYVQLIGFLLLPLPDFRDGAMAHRPRLPTKVLMNYDQLPEGDAVFSLGVTEDGPVVVNLKNTPHILAGGSTGSGKTNLVGSLLQQAIDKGNDLPKDIPGRFITNLGGGTIFQGYMHPDLDNDDTDDNKEKNDTKDNGNKDDGTIMEGDVDGLPFDGGDSPDTHS